MTPKKKPAKRKTTAKTAVVAKVPQPHGGALNAGGTPGNAGGGRLPSEVREAALQGAARAIPKLRRILAKGAPTEQIAAARELLRYGLGTKDEVTLISPEVTRRLEQQARIIASQDTWRANELLDRLSAEVWK